MAATGVLLSGGLDSAVLLADEATRGDVQPIYVRVGLAWEGAEQAMVAHFLSAARFRHSVRPLVTLSVGVATQVPTLDVASDGLLGQADQALYAAKRLGRNRVTSADTMLADVAGFIAAKRARRVAQR